MKYPLLKFYGWRHVFWLVRCNLVWFKDLRVLEFSLGLLGVGLVLQIYTKNRLK